MTAATTMGSLVADVLANYQETKGSAALRNAFQWASNASTSYGVALEENPVAAGAALIVGLATLVVLGPELATGAAVTSLAGTLVTASFGEISGVAAASISAALIGALAEQTGESLYNGVLAAENSIINSLGGTLTPQTVNSNSCIVTPLQAPTGSNLLLMVPGANDTIERYFMDFPYAVPGVSPNSLTISTNGNNALTLDQGAWSKVSYNGQQLVASLVSSTNQADGTLTVNAQSGQGTLTTTAGQTLFNIFGSTSFDVNNGSGSVTINLGGVPTGNLQSVIEGVTQRTDGSVTFTDTLGKTFSTYPVGQLTGGSIKVSGSEIDAYNSAGKIQNSTQELQLGVSNFGVLDKVYNSSGQYSFTRIFDPLTVSVNSGSIVTAVSGINNNGEVVGGFTSSSVKGTEVSGFTELNGVYTSLSHSDSSYTGDLDASLNSLRAINDNGVTVGSYTTQLGAYNALGGYYIPTSISAVAYTNGSARTFVDPNNKPFYLGVDQYTGKSLYSYETFATGINNQGVIVGWYNNNPSDFSTAKGFIDNNGTFTDVVNPSVAGNELLSISNNGVVLGEGSGANGKVDFYTFANGKFTDIPDLTAVLSSATKSQVSYYYISGINSSGVMAGSVDVSGVYEGFTYQSGNVSLIQSPSDYYQVQVTGINDKGQLVGNYNDAQAGVYASFIATPSTVAPITTTFQIAGAGTVDLRTQAAALNGTATTIDLAAGNNSFYFAGALETVVGSSGSNTYSYTSGDGADIIQNGVAANTGPTGELDFGTGITASQLTFAKTGQDLVVSVAGSMDKVTVQGWFANNYSQLQKIQTTGGPRLTNSNGVVTLYDTVTQIANDTGIFINYNLAVSDTAANIKADLADLQTKAAAGKLTSITFTDSTAPTLALTAAQVTSDAAVLAKVTSAYKVAVTDTAANIKANLAALQVQAVAGRLTSIILSDTTTPTITLTAAQVTADLSALAKITSAYKLTVTDTAANVQTNLAALQIEAAAGKLTSITFTDSAAPTLVLTAAQFTADAAALGKITSAYNLTVTGATVAQAISLSSNSHLTSLTVTDTASNVGGATNLTALQALAAAGKLASITLTNTTTPTLTLTDAQYTADTSALSKITSAYNLSVTNTAVAQVATLVANTHVTSIAVTDTAATIMADLTALQALTVAHKLASITLTNTTTPTLTLTDAQYTADATALSKITSAYSLTITSATVAQVATLAANAHVTSIAVTDTAAHVVAGLTALQKQAAAGKISSVALTDTVTPTLMLTGAQLMADVTALTKITTSYNETVTAIANKAEILIGTGTINTIDYTAATQGVVVNLVTGIATQTSGSTSTTDTLENFQNITGSHYADTMTAGANGGTLTGNGGTDTYVLNAKGVDIVKDSSVHLNGSTIKSFSSLDQIDLTDLAFGSKTTLSFAEDKSNGFGTLSLSDGTHHATIQLFGQYMASGFTKTSDAGAGTSVNYVPPANAAAILASAH